MKTPSPGNAEIRKPDSSIIARFNSFSGAARACVAARYVDVQIWECEKGGKAARWSLTAEFTTDAH